MAFCVLLMLQLAYGSQQFSASVVLVSGVLVAMAALAAVAVRLSAPGGRLDLWLKAVLVLSVPLLGFANFALAQMAGAEKKVPGYVTSKAENHPARTQSGKNPDMYYVRYVCDDGRVGEQSLRVGPEHYQSIKVGQPVTVTLREGALGPTVVSAEILESPK